MWSYIALFRGINVGGRHRLPMDTLKTLVSKVGCHNPQTYIQSGNLVFNTNRKDTDALAGEMGNAIEAELGFNPRVWLLSEQQWRQAIDANPFPTDDGKALHFFFLADSAEITDIDGLEALKKDSEAFVLSDSVFYLYAPEGIGRSKLVEKLEKYLPVPMTARNWNTVNKLQQMLEQNRERL